MLKSLLKEYLDGISLNDEVLKTDNPLFIVNHRIQLNQEPVEEDKKPVVVDGNTFTNQNIHQIGRSAAPQRFG